MTTNNSGTRHADRPWRIQVRRFNALAALVGSGAILLTALGGAGAARAADAGAAAVSSATPGGLEEIVVTAERREENLQRAPIAISVINAQDLLDKGVTSQTDLTRLIPAVSIYQGGQGSTQAAIRGVGNLAGNAFSEQAIAFSMDGIYLARGEAIGGNFFDLDRVEVLKGPQGTLYGRNTNAGAINIITQKPVLGQFGGNVNLEGGNYHDFKVEGALNVPVGDTSALRVAAQRVYHSGYLSDGYNDQNETDARISWLWKPTADVSLRVGGMYTQRGGRGDASALQTGQNGDFVGPSSPSQQAQWVAVRYNPILPNGYVDITDKGANAQLDWTTAAGTLTILPAYLKSTDDSLYNAPGFPIVGSQSSDSKSLEVRLASPSEQTLTWLLGGYYFDEDIAFTLDTNQTSFRALYLLPDVTTRSYAGFGQGTLKMAESWRLIFGARYTSEDKKFAGSETTSGFLPGFGPPAPPGAPACVYFTPSPVASLPIGCFTRPFANTINASKVTWKVGLEYELNATSMMYLTASTGFKAGGFMAAPNVTFKPETLTAFTLGSKNRFAENRLQFNVEAYYWKYKDKQVSHVGPRPDGVLDLVTENAGSATLYGLEPEVSYLVTAQDLLSATVAYEHTVYDTFKYTTVYPGPVGPGVCPNAGPVPTGFASNGAPLTVVNCSAFELSNSPKWVIAAAYRHTFELGNGGTLAADVAGHYRSSFLSAEEQTLSEHISGAATADASLTYGHPGGHFSLVLFVDNLADKESYGTAFFVGSAPSAGPRVGPLGPATIINPPRTFGLRLNTKF